jgi:hypothetical protein
LPERKTHAPRMAMATRRRAMGEGEESTRNSDMVDQTARIVRFSNGYSGISSDMRDVMPRVF